MNQILAGKGVTTLIIGIFGQRKMQELFFQGAFQERFSVNLWAGSHDTYVNRILRLDFLSFLHWNIYAEFLNMELLHLLDDILVPLVFRVNDWFHHEGAPPHFSRQAREILD
jgi:hypothetical protein